MKPTTPEFKEKLLELSSLSEKINDGDRKKILQLMKEHSEEIEELYEENNEHWKIETADLIILCYQLLILENKDIKKVFEECFPRYDKKLRNLLKEKKV
ncbi:MAG: hypothetical protein R6U26_04245 [Candidatus Undinarchaeales archaeon]